MVESKRIFVSMNFANMLEEFIEKYKEQEGASLTIIQATDIVYNKIKKAGGLVI